MTTATQEAVEQGIRHAQERYQSAIDLHEYVNPHHITHRVEPHCEHEFLSMRCYGDGRTECEFAVALVGITDGLGNDTYEAQGRTLRRDRVEASKLSGQSVYHREVPIWRTSQ